jgi:hypothetical protein
VSPIALGLDALLALLLLLALGLGLQLNGRLKALRESQAGFAAAVLELNQAAAKAEAGLAALKAASETAHDDLLARIETARSLTTRLERASAEAQRTAEILPERSAPPTRALGSASDTLAAIAALAEGRTPERRAPSAREEREVPPPPPRRPARPAFDEDLFEASGRDRDPLGPLRTPRGDR